MIDSVLDTLQGDALLNLILAGGIYRTQEISRQTTPDAFDGNRELLPCALLKQESRTPWGPYDKSARLYFQVFIYNQRMSDQIDYAVERIYKLLHRQKILPTRGGNWEVIHANDLLDMEDPALGVAMAVSRYVATNLRPETETAVFDPVEWDWDQGNERNTQALEMEF